MNIKRWKLIIVVCDCVLGRHVDYDTGWSAMIEIAQYLYLALFVLLYTG
jgi:hypothetical protein